jgi:hypothetical protein
MQQTTQDVIERRNTRFLYGDMLWISVAFAMEWYFLQVYAIRMGATPAHLGTLNSGRALLMVVGSGLTGRWLSRYSNMVQAIRWPAFAYRLILFLGIALVPLLRDVPGLKDHMVDVLVAMVVLSAIPTGITQGCFLALLRNALPESKLAGIVARRSVLMNAVVLVCVAFFGQLLERLPFPENYQIGFVIAFAATCVSWWSVQQIKPLTIEPADTTPEVEKLTPAKVNVWKNPVFVRYMSTVLAVCVGVFMAAPLIQLHLVRNLNASDSWISLFGMFEMAAGALITLRMDWLVNRFSTSRLIIVMAFATFFQTSILAVITTLPPFIIGTVLFGAGWFALGVLMFNRLVELVPQKEFPQYAAAYQLVINLALFIGPLIGTFLIEHEMTLPAALLATAAVRFGAGILSWINGQYKAKTPLVEASKTA